MALRAGLLTGVLGCWTDPPQCVHTLRDGLDVPRIYTCGIAAEVVEMQAVRNRRDESLVRESVAEHQDAADLYSCVPGGASTSELPAAVDLDAASEHPVRA